MGFLWEGSTAARAVQLLRTMPPGTVMLTPELAKALGAKQTLLHQLLANAVGLRLIAKVSLPGTPFSGWKLGAGNDSANIEPRAPKRPLSPAEAARAAAAAQRQRARDAERAAAESGGVGIRGAAVAELAASAPAWLSAPVGNVPHAEAKPPQAKMQRVVRWDVLYRDWRGVFHGDVQVLALHAERGVVEVWSGVHARVMRLDCAGFLRVVDQRSGYPVDLQAWLRDPNGKPPLLKPPKAKVAKARKAQHRRPVPDATRSAALAQLRGLHLLNEQQAAAYMGVSVPAFRALLHADALPPYVVLCSGKLRWRRAQLAAVMGESKAVEARAA
jgi:predicted DNA-binding transcriptional regulator AlpA